MFIYDNGMAITQIQFGFFWPCIGLIFLWPLLNTVWLFIEFLIWQPC